MHPAHRPNIGKRLPNYPVPAIIIARLARDARVRGKGYGERMYLTMKDLRAAYTGNT